MKEENKHFLNSMNFSSEMLDKTVIDRKQQNTSLIFNLLDESIVLLNATGELVEHNEAFQCVMHTHGFKVEEGRSILRSLTPEWKNVASEVLKSCGVSTATITLEFPVKSSDGREYSYEVKCKKIVFNNIDPYAVLVQIRDVTTQKIYEGKAIALAREYQSLVENASALIFATDSRGYVTEWNCTIAMVTGFTKDEALTKKLIPFIVMESNHEVLQNIFEFAMSGKATSSCELVIKSKRGSSIALLVNATPKLNAAGKVVGILFIAQDITELTAYKNVLEQKVNERTFELQQALRKEKEMLLAKDRFVAMATHEFKSPISYILNAVSKLKSIEHKTEPNELRSIYSKIESQLGHMSAFLGEILNVEKSVRHHIEATRTEIDSMGFFNSVIEDVRVSTNHTHRILFKPSVPATLNIDSHILRNVLVNLLTNAIKFSPGKESVELAVREQVGYLIINVSDNGVGIVESDIDKIFEPFSRGSNVAMIDGTGLGLSIVKKSVDILGGTVELTSELGKGSCFTVCVPLTCPRQG